MDLQDKKVLVVGSGKSGIGAVKLLHKAGAVPVLYDSNEKLSAKEIREKAGLSGLEVILGTIPESRKKEFALVAISPGVPIDAPLLSDFKAMPVPIWGEIELAYSFARGRVAAITGTNGKTTTTTLVGQIMKDHFPSVYVVGNIGNPFTDIALEMEEGSVAVAEISSFQLETVHSFHPFVSAILNITPDHLNRHHTMECYVKAKEAIAENQAREEVCVLNYEDPYTRDFGSRCPARAVFFSSKRELAQGVYLKGEDIYLAPWGEGEKGAPERLLNIHEMKLVGMCNVENVMAAIAICYAFGVPLPTILRNVKEFRAVEHRIEFVDTKGGVDYYNDSKGTNPDAAIQGIRAMTKPTVLIGGGYDKQSSYDEWVEAFDGKVKALVLVGQTKEAIARCAREHGVENIILADTFEEAFGVCVECARPGDAVLLSPACASWGMFSDYEARGRLFKELVGKIGV
ncbi:UDP-N-acetylmuramoylalanine--D-glutamate ligase [Lachnospiraceae bacterium]|nr:UDP-N-acetylmuramoylalanine--D-glutamate ligase [Lachnospiraceae bacterium]